MIDEYYSHELASRLHGDADIQHQSIMNVLIENEEYNLFRILKPKIYLDGNQWCVLHGENIMIGIAGFGDTPYLAILDFNKQFGKKIATDGK